MKVDGHSIFEITTHKKVLVEQTVRIWSHPEEVPIYANFDYRDVIGIAKVWCFKGKIFANLSLFVDVKGYPAIGYTLASMRIYCLGITNTPNKDPRIPMIGK